MLFALPGAALTRLPLTADAESSRPELTLLEASEEGARILFELPALEIETYQLAGETFHAALFAGCELVGAAGQPALPAMTRFVALPSRAGAQLRVLSMEEEILPGFRLLPMQPDEGTTFAQDAAAYQKDAFLGGEPVAVGAPLLMRGLRVVPVTFRPVQYNPHRGELRVLRRVELAIDFAGEDLRNLSRRASLPASAGFDPLHCSSVINYDAVRATRETPAADHLGTWLIISRDNSTVLSYLEPLVAWRQRMGYNVVQVTTNQTGTSPSSIKNYIQNAYDTWDDPPAYIVIVGDASGTFPIDTFVEDNSGYDGRGDHPYVQLDGDDDLPDAFIGRLSARYTTELRLITHKIVSYETAPYIDGPDWFSRACLIGDIQSVSGITCMHVQQWLKERLVDLGYTAIDTIWNIPYVLQIEHSVDRGVSYLGYRGYYGMSGWDIGDISATRNGRGMMPFAVNLTCDTGTWYSGTARSEAWLLAGSYPDSLSGGIGSIGTATPGTATRYNNCFYGGTAYGLFWDDHYQIGAAHARGKVEMVLNYGTTHPLTTNTYCHWNTLIGDPATEIWTAWPRTLVVDHPLVLPTGANRTAVTVEDDAGFPIAGAWVHLFQEGTISTGAETDALGEVVLPVPSGAAGTVAITVTGHNLYPYQGDIQIQQLTRFVGMSAYTIDDGAIYPGNGNGSGALNPGEQIGIEVELHNTGLVPAYDVSLTMTSDDPYAGIISAGPVSYGTIYAGATGTPSSGDLVLRIPKSTPDGHELVFDLAVSDQSGTWQSRLALTVLAPSLIYEDHVLTGCDEVFDPGESAELTVSLRNVGAITAPGPISAYLSSDNYWIQVIDPDGTYDDSIAKNDDATNSSDPFEIVAPADAIPGQLIPLRLALTCADGSQDTAQVFVTLGTKATSDPTGPDAYGYFAYDHTDVAYPEAPVYDWIDITGTGSEVGLTDYGYDDDDSKVVDLPFVFTFYGEDFDRATICSNGWMAMGSTYLINYRNWYMPSAGGPAYMIAPFWDNLHQHSNGKVYHWFDQANHRYIVSWDNVWNYECYQAVESCQAILYDPDHYPTYTGDGVIVFQYKHINQVDFQQMYSTSGIQNGDHTVGLTYSYSNRRPPGAVFFYHPLAIKFTTGSPGAAAAHSAGSAQPRVFLAPSRPNPCSRATTIRFGLDQPGPVGLRLFDPDGRLVRTLIRGVLPPGDHEIEWQGRDEAGHLLPSGVYFYRLETDDGQLSRQLLLMR